MAGLPLLHAEEPELRGPRRLVEAAHDRVLARLWSPALDLTILWRTVFAVLRRRGAY